MKGTHLKKVGASDPRLERNSKQIANLATY